MANVDCARLPTVEEQRRCAQRHARLMYGVAYPLCLAIVAVSRLAPRRAEAGGFGGRRSIFSEASHAASMCIPFAFR